MKRFVFIIATLLICAMASAQNRGIGTKEKPRKFEQQVGQFDRLKVTDNVNVVYRNVPDSTGLIAYVGEEDFADSFIFTNKNGELRIQVTTEDVGKPGLPTIYAYSDFITLAENDADFTLRVESMAPCPEFKAVEVGNGTVIVDDVKANKVSAMLNTGNGTLTLSGQCGEATYKMIGTGLIQADLLKADKVNCRILGSGSIGCWPLEILDVKGLGSTKIYYKGAPEIKKSGTAKLIPIPEQQIDVLDDSDDSDVSDASDSPASPALTPDADSGR